jgi:hypothetical protein
VAGALCATMFACGAPAPAPSPSPQPQTSFAFSGRVTDLTTGAPLTGASITILDGSNASRSATSDAAGAFRIADLTVSGFTARVRRDGYDSEFRSINLTADTAINVPMTPAMTTLSGTWAGTLSFSFSPPETGRQDVTIPQLAMMQAGGNVSSSTFSTLSSFQGSVSGTLQDPSAIGSTTTVTGMLTLIQNLSGRNPTTCRGTSSFTGTINWTRMTTTTPRLTLDCGVTYLDVTLALVRQQ